MKLRDKWLKITGIVLNVLIGGLMLFAGSVKVIGMAPPSVVEALKSYDLYDKMLLIGVGEMTAAALLLIPVTAPLGTLATSGFWGGVICIHMAHHQNFAPFCVLLAVTWIGSFLRGSMPLFACQSCQPKSPAP